MGVASFDEDSFLLSTYRSNPPTHFAQNRASPGNTTPSLPSPWQNNVSKSCEDLCSTLTHKFIRCYQCTGVRCIATGSNHSLVVSQSTPNSLQTVNTDVLFQFEVVWEQSCGHNCEKSQCSPRARLSRINLSFSLASPTMLASLCPKECLIRA